MTRVRSAVGEQRRREQARELVAHGRPGLAALGVGPSGAADRGSFRLGARLVAQDYEAAAIEVTFGGLEVRAHQDLTLDGAAR